MNNDKNMIDARKRFRPQGLEYKVQINIEINAGFLWAIAKCIFQRKDLRITHTFTNDPLLPVIDSNHKIRF